MLTVAVKGGLFFHKNLGEKLLLLLALLLSKRFLKSLLRPVSLRITVLGSEHSLVFILVNLWSGSQKGLYEFFNT